MVYPHGHEEASNICRRPGFSACGRAPALEDTDRRGDHLILRPAPEDPIEAARGAFKDYPGPSVEEGRRQFREEEREAEERKFGPDPD
jgi:hypothetical protein